MWPLLKSYLWYVCAFVCLFMFVFIEPLCFRNNNVVVYWHGCCLLRLNTGCPDSAQDDSLILSLRFTHSKSLLVFCNLCFHHACSNLFNCWTKSTITSFFFLLQEEKTETLTTNMWIRLASFVWFALNLIRLNLFVIA